MKPLRDLGDPDLRPRVDGTGGMAFGFLVFAAAVVVITIAGLSARDLDEKMETMEQHQRDLAAVVRDLQDIVSTNAEHDKALGEAIATIAVEAADEER